MLKVSAPPHDTITDLLSGGLNLHQEAKYHSSSLRKTFLKPDTAVVAVIFSLSTNEPHTQAAVILVRKRRRKTKITSLTFCSHSAAEREAAEMIGVSEKGGLLAASQRVLQWRTSSGGTTFHI